MTKNNLPDSIFLQRCFELAARGAGFVSPNPQVGAVIVHDGRVIGEGFHAHFGQAHAEVNAVNSVSPNDRHLLPHSTIYVSLEPCSHVGKTPPCADLLIRERFKRVVVATLDPNPLVAGSGIQKLRAQGIEVEMAEKTPELTQQIEKTLQPFFVNIEQKRPYIVLKWAEDAAKNMGLKTKPVAISNAESQRLTHRWRAEADAVLVGTNTVLVDNPKLDIRFFPSGRPPLRVVLDRFGKIGSAANVFKTSENAQKTLVFSEKTDGYWGGDILVEKIDFDDNFLENMLQILYKKYQIGILFVEGGGALHQSFLNQNLWDEARVFKSHQTILQDSFNEVVAAPKILNPIFEHKKLLDNELYIFKNKK
ncbi:MAG: bifunctional diaminohydroxyphosphoribosylaminopyrimidine [Bacteroidota bacterium]|jgi:diaminohydroxyphosphoribosylaminopyrimidine deaminase/5-amino-6-(5-phosphoribosylamino)uracil reductase